MISAEQIAAVDRAIVFLTHEHPRCRLHVGLEEIVVELEDGDVLVYDVYRDQYIEERCEECGNALPLADMRVSDKCIYCEEEEDE